MMRSYIIKIFLVTTVIFLMPLNSVPAFGAGIDVMQVYLTEQTMTVFTSAEMQADRLQVLVSNQNADVTAAGLLSDEQALIKTTILVDISTSMPSAVRGRVIDMLGSVIRYKLPNEEFRVAVFGEQLNILHDFSPDRYDLANAIRQISFDNRESRIYEAIFDTLPNIGSVEARPTFQRTIVITDGVDNAAIGITREELFHRLQSDRYPIDVISVSNAPAAENRELAAIARISGGRYFALNPDTDPTALASWLGVGNYFFVEATVPVVLLDGVTRQVDISDGTNSISTDVRFPVFGVPAAETQAEIVTETNAATRAEPAAETIEQPSAETDLMDFTDFIEEHAFLIIVGVGVLIFAVILIIVIVVWVGRKKKGRIAAAAVPANRPVLTELINDTPAQYTIKMSDLNDRSQSWTLPVTGDLLIGRADYCAVKFNDNSVSREQCKIIAANDGLAVVQVGSANKTFLNENNVAGNTAIQSGDILKFGRSGLYIDYIQTLGAQASPQEQPHTPSSKGKTESIF